MGKRVIILQDFSRGQRYLSDGFSRGLGNASRGTGLCGCVAPVPATGASTVHLSLPVPAAVDLRVFDVMGRVAVGLCSGFLPAGETTLDFNAGELPCGVYIIGGDIGGTGVSTRFAVISD